jgi:hypothetical protein
MAIISLTTRNSESIIRLVPKWMKSLTNDRTGNFTGASGHFSDISGPTFLLSSSPIDWMITSSSHSRGGVPQGSASLPFKRPLSRNFNQPRRVNPPDVRFFIFSRHPEMLKCHFSQIDTFNSPRPIWLLGMGPSLEFHHPS